ncbi:transcription factor VOZ1 [Lolium perenne]|uniref:transcription factor VOZ1 n=1 Tax=Lolium perenne TaxID=4522 RepID=UPI0021EB3B9E|nr:transcription factor VOZ1-like [Lolium perenne]
MAGDPAGGGGGGGSATGKSPRSSSRHRQFRDRAKTRVDDLQEIFSGLQSARQESRSADAAVLEEQVHQMLREWRAELSVASPASSLQNSLGNSQGAADPPSETLRLLQLAIEEEDDATSKLAIPRSSRLSHGLGQDDQNLNAELQVQGENVAGGAPVTQQSLGHEVMGDYSGEVADVANALFNDQMYYDHELSIDDFLHGSNPVDLNNQQEIRHLEHEQCNLPLDLQPPSAYVDANSSVQNTGDVLFDMSDLLTTMSPSPSQYLGPKCALWDCGRPVWGSDECQDYCNPYHAGLALNDDGLLGTMPVMRPRGIDLKDGPLFDALCAKLQGKNVGIPVCEGAATSKSPWNAPELFDLSLLEGESLREWLFFDRPRRAFESGNRKQRSLPDYNGRGWHESRKQVMKDFAGLKKSYYMDPQPSTTYEWHLFEYEINDSNALALYRLEFKASDAKRTKLASNSLNEIQQQMGKLSANSPVDNKRTARSKTKANQKDSSASTNPVRNTPNKLGASSAYETVSLNTPNQVSSSSAYKTNQVSTSNAYQAVSEVDPMSFLNENVVYGPHLPYG